jgi:hypothetical protein
MFRIVKGSTLLVPSGPAHDPDRLHLHIALTDAFQDASDGKSRIVLASLSSIPGEGQPYDATCIIIPGEHVFVRRKSYVNYAFATLYSVETLAARCAEGTCQRQDAVSTALLVRMLKGSLNSIHTKQRIRGLCKIAYKDLDDDDIRF